MQTSHLYPWVLSQHRIAGLVNVFIYYMHKVHTIDCVKQVYFFYHAESFVILHGCFKGYVPLQGDLHTCQVQAPVALCCLIHAQSLAA